MSETVIVGILSLLGTLGGAYFANRKNTALVVYRIDRLEDKVNKHNEVIERTYNLEKRMEVDEQRLKVTEHRLEDLEGYHK